MNISLTVEISAFGICRGFPTQYGIFVVNVQKESSQSWTVYRRFASFLSLSDQLKSLNPTVPQVPQIDDRDITLEYMEYARSTLNSWLETILRDECILRTQSMYQFLCADANMPPPYVDIHWKTRNEVNFNEDDMDMDFMYDKNTNDGMGEDGFEDEDLEDFGESHDMESSQPGGRQAGVKRPATDGMALSYRRPVDLQGESAEDVAEGLDIQTLSVVEAEFIFDRDLPDDENNQMALSFQSSALLSQQDSAQPAAPKRIISLESFDIIKVIGKGSFGKVFLVRDKAKKTIHAMKVLKKDYIIKKNQVRLSLFSYCGYCVN